MQTYKHTVKCHKKLVKICCYVVDNHCIKNKCAKNYKFSKNLRQQTG